jgi:cytochrome c oxidase subunit 2
MSRVLRASAAALAVGMAGCDSPMQVLSGATEATSRVARLAWFMIILSAVVYVGTMAAMGLAIRRNRRRSPAEVDLSEPGVGWVVAGGAVMPALVLVAVFVVSLTAMGRVPGDRATLTIKVIGHQWWWEAEYEMPQLQQRFRTANEIHVPAGRPVRLLLTTADVIHSFWVPTVQGKMDLIPGDTNEIRFTIPKAGTYAGSCAEFCGMQHAKMGIRIIADDSATFAAWTTAQQAPAVVDTATSVGAAIFLSGPCAMCHTVRGTLAGGSVGPDLTHVGSRGTIAAGTLPNTLGTMEAWIANAQSLKPGAKMPTLTGYDGRQLRALATYLESLR